MSESAKKPSEGVSRKWWGYGEFCEAYGVSRPTAERLVARGLPCLRLGRLVRFNPDAVQAWLERHGAR